jgi:hypothetical protein
VARFPDRVGGFRIWVARFRSEGVAEWKIENATFKSDFLLAVMPADFTDFPNLKPMNAIPL